MSKLFKKLILLALGSLCVLSIFAGCTEEVKKEENKEEKPVEVTSFLENVGGKEFQLVINKEGFRNIVNEKGDIYAVDMADSTSELLFKFVETKSSTTAIYSPKSKPTKYFGVKINDLDNSRLDLYLDNKAGGGRGVYWSNKTDVKFESSKDVLLATKSINKTFKKRLVTTLPNIPDANIPASGEISIVSTGTKNAYNKYILAGNQDGQSGSLFRSGKDLVQTNIPSVTSAGIRTNSLQAIGDKLFIVHKKVNTVTIYDNKSKPITGTSAISDTTDFTIGKGDDTSFYIATLNAVANLYKVTTAGIQTPVPLISNTMQPKSLTMLDSDVYVAGIVTGKATVNKVSGTTSTDITDLSLPTTDVTDIKLIAVEGYLYAVVDNTTANKIFKFDNTATPKWTDLTGSITLPTDITSVITDGTVIYTISGATQADFKVSAYQFDPNKPNATIVWLGSHGNNFQDSELQNVTAGAVVLPDTELYTVYATKTTGIPTLFPDYFYLIQTYYQVDGAIFKMP